MLSPHLYYKVSPHSYEITAPFIKNHHSDHSSASFVAPKAPVFLRWRSPRRKQRVSDPRGAVPRQVDCGGLVGFNGICWDLIVISWDFIVI